MPRGYHPGLEAAHLQVLPEQGDMVPHSPELGRILPGHERHLHRSRPGSAKPSPSEPAENSSRIVRSNKTAAAARRRHPCRGMSSLQAWMMSSAEMAARWNAAQNPPKPGPQTLAAYAALERTKYARLDAGFREELAPPRWTTTAEGA